MRRRPERSQLSRLGRNGDQRSGRACCWRFSLALPCWSGSTRDHEAAGFTSHDKDLLMEESQEILPEIYQHPEGWFIV
ncbi:hypothetical protein, partial [Pedomonas mirosovicensis]|uniref:hypothetical protein n=1 Tax=Pedomonas mirosovicensis TaxID=2908641 RepID=UPI00216959B4